MNRMPRRSAAEAADALLEAGRTQPVLNYDVELGLARHHRWLLSEAPLPEWASAGAAVKSLVPVVVKTIVSALLAGTVAVAAWHARGGLQPSAARSTPAVAHPPAPSVPDVREIPMPVVEPDVPVEEPVRRVVRADVPDKRMARLPRSHKGQASSRTAGVPVVANAAAESPRTSVSAAPTPVTAHASVSASAARATHSDAEAAPEQKTISTVQRVRPEPGSRAQAPDDMVEMQQVASAEQLLERSPQRALALVRQGDQRFAHGYFQQERAYIAIMALIRLGRVDEARARAASFAKQFPPLPYGARIRSALEAHDSDR
jgi:hypothetical protein